LVEQVGRALLVEVGCVEEGEARCASLGKWAGTRHEDHDDPPVEGSTKAMKVGGRALAAGCA